MNQIVEGGTCVGDILPNGPKSGRKLRGSGQPMGNGGAARPVNHLPIKGEMDGKVVRE